MVVTDTDWEDFDDLDSFGISICLSTGRPTAHEGRHIYETDTNKTMRYTGAAWVELAGGGGVTDHGALTGLADDDHTQYVLVDGTRAMTGDLTINKVGPKFIAKPTDSDSPALILEDTASNYKGRVYVTGDDMVVLGEDGELYLSTAVSTGGNVLLETKGVTRLTIADATLTSTIPLAMGTNKVTGLAAATASGDALRYEQIADASFMNLLSNGDFESWSAGASSAPDGWIFASNDGSIARESSIVKVKTYSHKLIRGTATYCYLEHVIQNYSDYANKTITLGMWIYATSADAARLLIHDGSTSYSSTHPGDSTWHFITVTKTISGSPSHLKVYSRLDDNDTVGYFDGAILVEGSICPEFSPKPLADDGKSIQIDSTTNTVTLGRDPTADTEAATKKYVDDNSGGVGDFLANGTVPMTGNLQMGDNDITGADTLQATASQNLTLKVSTGSSIVFQAV